MVLLYWPYPEILRKIFSLMNCLELDNQTGKRFLRLSTTLECWSELHTFWVLAVGMPGFIIWGIAVPFLLLAVLVKNKAKISEIIREKRLGIINIVNSDLSRTPSKMGSKSSIDKHSKIFRGENCEKKYFS